MPMAKRRTRKHKVTAKRVTVRKEGSLGVKENKEVAMFKADLTKSLWLTMLAVGLEVALWYLWKPGY